MNRPRQTRAGLLRWSWRLASLVLATAAELLSQDSPVFRADANLVTVPCAVTDAKGVAIRDLSKTDFRLWVDRVPQEIQHLWPQTDLPSTFGVIVDVSESQRKLVTQHQQLAAQFLDSVVGPQDSGFVIAVNGGVTLRSDVTRGPYGLREHISSPRGEPFGPQCGSVPGDRGRWRPVCGGTALWNAVYFTARLRISAAKGNKVLLILSDGNDTGSTHHFPDALEQAKRSGAVVYVMRYPDAERAPDPAGELGRLARETGGALFESPEQDYPEILARIATDLRSRYVLGFQPQASRENHQRHTLRVEVTTPGAVVRARPEYFDPEL